jgi:DNA polymerase V
MASEKNPKGMSELHKLLGMTPAEVRLDLMKLGIDPKAELAAARRLGRVLAAQFADQIERERDMGLAAASKPFPKFAEAVAAGAPAWADGATCAPETASLLDVLSDGSTDDTVWARVSGWSMRDDGINDGDLVLVNTKLEANDGDIVLAHLAAEGQVVKRLRRSRGRVTLQSANPDFADIEIDDPSTLRIQGVVVGRAGKL